MTWISLVAGPVVGAVIGYITNALAIRMLFRPYEPKYLLGRRLPFTPGIIPKEKGRIALSLGQAISDNLMNREVLEKNLLSPDMVAKVRAVEDFIAAQKTNGETVREFAGHFVAESELDEAIAGAKKELSSQVADKLKNSMLGEKIAQAVIDHVADKLSIDGLNIPQGGLASTLLGAPLWKALGNAIRKPATVFLTKNIDSMLDSKGEEIASGLISKGIDDFAATPVKKLLDGKDDELGKAADAIVGLYERMIKEQLPKILATVDIPRIIEGRINEMDMAETEKLIFAVMDKELKAIIWLGAGLGFLMGFVNVLASYALPG